MSPTGIQSHGQGMKRKPVTNAQRLPQPKGQFVYCYLRTNRNLPYYIGQGSRPDRMTSHHTCKIPKDRSRIRIMREGLDQAGADYWEAFYIDHYGCKHDGTGCLVNLRDGGRHGGNLSEEVTASISAKVTELHKQGVFDAVNSRDSIDRRRAQRVFNLANRLGVDPDQYAALTTWERDYLKTWLKDHPGASIDNWRGQLRSAKAAARYQMKLEDWEPLSNKQKNAIKEFCKRHPECTGYDYFTRKPNQIGEARQSAIAQMVAMTQQGMTQAAIGAALGLSQTHVSKSLKLWRQQQQLAS